MNLLAQARHMWRKMKSTKAVAPEEIEAALRLPIVAIIPHLERRNKLPQTGDTRKRQLDLSGRWRSRLISYFPDKSPAALAYDSLLCEMVERSRSRRQKAWLFSGSVAGEGTSLSCMNLAIAAGRRGVKTLILEAHVRSPRISRILELDSEPGLTGCLQRALSPTNAIQSTQFPAWISCLRGPKSLIRKCCGARRPFSVFLRKCAPYTNWYSWRARYPFVSRLRRFADKVDGIVVINQYGRTPPERVKKAIEKLGPRQDILLGVMLNDSPLR